MKNFMLAGLLSIAVCAAVYSGVTGWMPAMLGSGSLTAGSTLPVIINHQGVVAVNGTRFTGTAGFKFAIINTDTGLSLWTNDNTQVGGSNPPTASINLTVNDGIYSVALGDAGMAAIPAAVFTNSNTALRVWFNDGSNGQQQLSPDQKLRVAPYAVRAETVSAGAIGTTELADGAVTPAKLAAEVAVIPVGTVVTTVLSNAPDGWLLCDGSAVSRETYAALFAGIGTTYGPGDGSTTFNLPDFRGRVPLGTGSGTGNGASGASGTKPTGGSALSARNRGDWGGAQTHTLTVSEIPAHKHQINLTWGVNNSNNSNPAVDSWAQTSNIGAGTNYSNPILNAGGGAAHNNMQPFMAISFMVKY